MCLWIFSEIEWQGSLISWDYNGHRSYYFLSILTLIIPGCSFHCVHLVEITTLSFCLWIARNFGMLLNGTPYLFYNLYFWLFFKILTIFYPKSQIWWWALKIWATIHQNFQFFGFIWFEGLKIIFYLLFVLGQLIDIIDTKQKGTSFSTLNFWPFGDILQLNFPEENPTQKLDDSTSSVENDKNSKYLHRFVFLERNSTVLFQKIAVDNWISQLDKQGQSYYKPHVYYQQQQLQEPEAENIGSDEPAVNYELRNF